MVGLYEISTFKLQKGTFLLLGKLHHPNHEGFLKMGNYPNTFFWGWISREIFAGQPAQGKTRSPNPAFEFGGICPKPTIFSLDTPTPKKKHNKKKLHLVGGFNPIQKYMKILDQINMSQIIDHFPRVGVKIRNL